MGVLGVSVAVLAVVGSPTPRLAKACGGVFSPRLMKDERKPSLAYEQALLIHDPSVGREHLIREVVFRAGTKPFGFVVPTPSRPEVAKVGKSPFERLRTFYPFRDPDLKGAGSAQGFGSGRGAPGGGVRVLEVKKVGSFTAFVLAADDEAGLSDWLKKHGLESAPEARDWLAHHVRARSFFVAMRYDPWSGPDAPTGRTESETIRVSFDTPLPYYPYFEPEPAAGGAVEEPRLLEVWFVTPRPAVPVALCTAGGTPRWVRPFAEGRSFERPPRADVEEALGTEAKLLFPGQPIVQRFMDQKRSRRDFRDVVFVPGASAPLDAKQLEAARPLLIALDPSLAAGAVKP
jgi:hypothetical protein